LIRALLRIPTAKLAFAIIHDGEGSGLFEGLNRKSLQLSFCLTRALDYRFTFARQRSGGA
jgi:hypothetical protein